MESLHTLKKEEWIGFCKERLTKGKDNFTNRTFVGHISCSCYRCELFNKEYGGQIEYKTNNKDCTEFCTEEQFFIYVYKDIGNRETHGDLAINLLEMEIERTMEEGAKSNETKYSISDIHIKGHRSEVLLEYSADVSVVNIQIMESLNENQLIRWDRKQNSTYQNLHGPDGRRMTIATMGKALLKLALGEQDFEWEFLVVDSLLQDCILGRDFIREKSWMFDWVTCPNQYSSNQNTDYFCRNSPLEVRIDISRCKFCTGYEEHWFIAVMTLHIGLDMCSHTISVDYKQLEETMLELTDMMHEGIGIELTTNEQRTCCNIQRKRSREDPKSYTPIREDRNDITREEDLIQKWRQKMGIKINTNTEQTRLQTTPSLENIAANVIILNKAYRKCLQRQKIGGSKEVITGCRNLFRRYIRHGMRLTCPRWKCKGMGKYTRTFKYPYLRGYSEENLIETHEIFGNMYL